MKNQVSNSEILRYATASGETKLEVKLENETVWLSQEPMAELFGKDLHTVNEHIQHIFSEGELERESNYPEIPDSSKGKNINGFSYLVGILR